MSDLVPIPEGLKHLRSTDVGHNDLVTLYDSAQIPVAALRFTKPTYPKQLVHIEVFIDPHTFHQRPWTRTDRQDFMNE